MSRKLSVNTPRDVNFEINRDHWLNELRVLQAQRGRIAEGGGRRRHRNSGLREKCWLAKGWRP